MVAAKFGFDPNTMDACISGQGLCWIFYLFVIFYGGFRKEFGVLLYLSVVFSSFQKVLGVSRLGSFRIINKI
jgi:hypothetical protein